MLWKKLNHSSRWRFVHALSFCTFNALIIPHKKTHCVIRITNVKLIGSFSYKEKIFVVFHFYDLFPLHERKQTISILKVSVKLTDLSPSCSTRHCRNVVWPTRAVTFRDTSKLKYGCKDILCSGYTASLPTASTTSVSNKSNNTHRAYIRYYNTV